MACLVTFLLFTGQMADLKYNSTYNWFSSPDLISYLQYSNSKIFLISNMIIGDSKTDDEKAEKVFSWVVKNFDYKSDKSVYGQIEYWATPIESLKNMKGDCEDGATLIHSLLLHAGIPSDRIRTYGGMIKNNKVINGKEIPNGLTGHSWTTYRRQSDNQWVALDWCNENYHIPISDMKPIKNDSDYVREFMYFNLFEHNATPITIKIIENI